jgi:dihydrofolate reductase
VADKMTELMRDDFDLLLGRRTYEIFAAYWPHSTDPVANGLNTAEKYVASRTLTNPTWENTTVISDDVEAEVRALKEADGPEIQVHGSANLLQTLLASDVVDELHMLVFPVILGKGKRLFGDRALPTSLELVDSATSTTGVSINSYRRAGDVPTGSFPLS